MFIEQIPVIFRWRRGVKWRMSHAEKKLYLTFDDGPVPEETPWVLDLLDSYHIKATFFCVGENVSRHPELYAEILHRGHRTGNHSYNHLNGLHCNLKDYLNNVEKAAALIDSNLFRPAHGWMKPSQFRALNGRYRIVLWDVITRDYNPKRSPGKILRNACRYVRNGSIIVFHDSIKSERNMRAVLAPFIEYCLSKGYSFELI